MQADEFMRRVQELGRLETGEEAAKIVKATLETLSERVTRIERGHLATQLPEELQHYIYERNATERYPLEEFYNRVAGRSDLRRPEAIERTHVVMAVLQEAVSPGEMADIRKDLPEEYEELFTGEPSGPTSSLA